MAELEALLAEAAEVARRGLPIGLTEQEAFALAILSGEPALARQLLERPPLPRTEPGGVDARGEAAERGTTARAET